jgi:hypothetical protein
LAGLALGGCKQKSTPITEEHADAGSAVTAREVPAAASASGAPKPSASASAKGEKKCAPGACAPGKCG